MDHVRNKIINKIHGQEKKQQENENEALLKENKSKMKLTNEYSEIDDTTFNSHVNGSRPQKKVCKELGDLGARSRDGEQFEPLDFAPNPNEKYLQTENNKQGQKNQTK